MVVVVLSPPSQREFQWFGSGGRCKWNSVAVFDGINDEWFGGGHVVEVCEIGGHGAKRICLLTTK